MRRSALLIADVSRVFAYYYKILHSIQVFVSCASRLYVYPKG